MKLPRRNRPVPGVEDTGLVGRHKPPAPASTPGPGTTPAPGKAAGPPVPASPAPGPPDRHIPAHLTHGKRVWTLRRYADGAVFHWDAHGHVTPLLDSDWDEALGKELAP